MDGQGRSVGPDLLEVVADLKHDLGKYSSWMSANLDDAEWEGPVSDGLVDALRRDLLRTRTGLDGGPESAWAVWERLAADLPRPLPAPELETVEAGVEVLRRAEVPLRRGDRDALAALRGVVREAQQSIRSELLRLHRRLLRAQDRG
ncbi:MAG: hypothetical protein KC486_24810 [Myxococcales bacterium]|nr:hypothetical protein [Myxococcales bacterium]